MEQPTESDSEVNFDEPSEYEKAARKARAKYSTATVSLLQSLHSQGHVMKIFTGNAFVIKLGDQGGCKLITCQHLINQNLIDDNYQLWARFFGASQDVKVTIEHYNRETDIAILDVAKVPDTPKGPIVELQFTKKRKVGTTVILLGYFNPEGLPSITRAPSYLIAKNPNAVPGKISGPLVLDIIYPTENNWLLSVDTYGIYGSCGSPIIASESEKVVAMFKQSVNQIHFGIAKKTIKEQLREWLQASQETTFAEMIEAL